MQEYSDTAKCERIEAYPIGLLTSGTTPAILRWRLKLRIPGFEIKEPVAGISSLSYRDNYTTLSMAEPSQEPIGELKPNEPILNLLYKKCRDIPNPGYQPTHLLPQGTINVNGGSYQDTIRVLRHRGNQVALYNANPARKISPPLRIRQLELPLDELESPKRPDGWPQRYM